MKTTSTTIVLLLTISIFFSCGNNNTNTNIEKKTEESLDYTKIQVLDSLIKHIPSSNDSIFLGFVMGMTKSKYKEHINNQKKAGKKITYSSSHTLTTTVGEIQLGEGYTFETGISTKINGQLKTGEGKYLLEPHYNAKGELNQLSILPSEEWDNDLGSNNLNWLNTNIQENSSPLNDESLEKALSDLKVIKGRDLIRRKGNVIIYEGRWSVTYIDFKTLLNKMVVLVLEREAKQKESKDVKF
jgi:hypothetical protein